MNEEIISKPWGFEKYLIKTKNYVGKILHINKGCRLSLQFHELKEETIYVLSGTLCVDNGGANGGFYTHKYLQSGEVHHVPPNTVHRFSAPLDDVEVLEMSSPEIDDVVRIEDDYGRVEK